MLAVMYNKNMPVAQVEIVNGKVTKICEKINPQYLPISLLDNLTTESLNSWIFKRRLPADREGMENVVRNFEYFKGYPEFDRYGCMFSLSDQYWFRYEKSQSWENMNFFTNRYPDDVGRLFFYPWELEKDHIFGESPDLTTNGLLRKRWKQDENGDSYLIKAGSKRLRQEPISEVLATILLRKLEIIPYVEYELTVEGMRLCSKCKNFVTKDTEFVPAGYIYFREKRREDETIYQHLLRMCSVYGIYDAKKYIDNMIAVDRIIGNEDRHLGNFGFIRDVTNLKITGFAPLFDSGYSFVPNGHLPKDKRIIFDEELKVEALSSAIRKVNMKKLMDHEEMFTLIEVYPELNKEEKDHIKNRILASEKEIARLAHDDRRFIRPSVR